MSSIVYQIDKKTGAKYAFESTSYWDKVKQQPRCKRKYLGKVDPETGKIIPSRGRVSHADPKFKADLSKLYEEIKKRDKTIDGLRRDLDTLNTKYQKLLLKWEKVRNLVGD